MNFVNSIKTVQSPQNHVEVNQKRVRIGGFESRDIETLADSKLNTESKTAARAEFKSVDFTRENLPSIRNQLSKQSQNITRHNSNQNIDSLNASKSNFKEGLKKLKSRSVVITDSIFGQILNNIRSQASEKRQSLLLDT